MTKEAAKAYYQKQAGDPDTGYISAADAQASLDVVYTDMASGDATATATIPDGSVTETKIGPDAVTAAKIAPNAVGASELADNAVDTAAIADSAVTSAKIAAGTIAKVTHPNTDDVLVQMWDSTAGRWQTSHYDSGWRDVSASVTPGPGTSGVSLQMRRYGNRVYSSGVWNQDGTAPTACR